MDVLSLDFLSTEERSGSEEEIEISNDFLNEDFSEKIIMPHSDGTVGKKSFDTNEMRELLLKNVENTDSSLPAPWSDNRKLNIISLDELSWHDNSNDCWLAIYDYVYDCTTMIDSHPGGHDVILEYAGRDATIAFIGTGHSRDARKLLKNYLIGELPDNERLFRKVGGVRIVEL